MRNVQFRFPSVAQKTLAVFLTTNSTDFFIRDLADLETQNGKKRVFNNGNPANAFQVATSKQLLLERAQRLVTALAEKLVEPHFGYVIRYGVLTIVIEKGSQ